MGDTKITNSGLRVLQFSTSRASPGILLQDMQIQSLTYHTIDIRLNQRLYNKTYLTIL